MLFRKKKHKLSSIRLASYDEIGSVRVSGTTEDEKAVKYTVSLALNPYSIEAIDFMEAVAR